MSNNVFYKHRAHCCFDLGVFNHDEKIVLSFTDLGGTQFSVHSGGNSSFQITFNETCEIEGFKKAIKLIAKNIDDLDPE